MNNYELSISTFFKNACKLWVLAGMLLLIFFGSSIFFKQGNVTIGHFCIATLFLVGGFLMLIGANRWKIYVTEKEIAIQFILKKRKTLTFNQIEKVEIDAHKNLRLFSNGKKIITIDCYTLNYSLFIKDLKSKGLQIEYKV